MLPRVDLSHLHPKDNDGKDKPAPTTKALVLKPIAELAIEDATKPIIEDAIEPAPELALEDLD